VPSLVSTIPQTSNLITTGTNSLRFNLNGIVDGETIYYLTADAGFVKSRFNNFDNEPITDDTSFKYTTGAGPKISLFTPVNNTVNSSATTISFVFNKGAITKNTGNWYLKSSNGSTVSTIPVTSSTITLTTGTNSATVSFNLLGIVDTNETYYLNSDFGTFRDSIPFSFDGNISSSTWKYSIGDVGPKINSTLPVNSSTNFGIGLITITYDRNTFPPKTSDRKFYIYRDGSLLQTLELGNSALIFSTLTNTISVNYTGTSFQSFWNGGSTYHIRADKGAVRDRNFFSANAITDSSVFSFTTAPKPFITATNLLFSGTNIYTVVEYDRPVVKDYFVTSDGSNWLRINKVGGSMGSTPFFSYPGGGNVGVTQTSGKTFLVNLSARNAIRDNLTKATYFYSSNSFAAGDPDRMSQATFGQLPATTFTITGALVTSTNITYGGYINTGSLTLNYDRNIRNISTGNVYIYEGTTEPGTLVNTFAPNNARITTSTNRLSINVFGLLQGEKTYWIQNDDGVFFDLFSFSNDPINDSSKVKFLTSNTNFTASIPQNNSTIRSKNFVVKFNKNILTKGTGTLFLSKESSPDIVVASTSSISIASLTTSSVGFTFGNDIYEKNTNYYVTATENVVYDAAGITSTAVIDNTVLKFSTDNGPVLTTSTGLPSMLDGWSIYEFSLHPIFSASDTGGQNGFGFDLIFDRPIFESTGTITVYNTSSQVQATYNNSSYSISSVNTNTLLFSTAPTFIDFYSSYYFNWNKDIAVDDLKLNLANENTSTTLTKFNTGVVSKFVYNAPGNGTAEFGKVVGATRDYVWYSRNNGINWMDINNKDSRGIIGAPTYIVKEFNGSQDSNVGIIVTTDGITRLIQNSGAFFPRNPDYSSVPTFVNISNNAKNTIISYMNTATLVWVTTGNIKDLGTTPSYTVTHPYGSTNTNFGQCVDIGTSSYVISSPKEAVGLTIERGCVFVYNNNTSTVNFSIDCPVDNSGTGFGNHLDIYGDRILIGSPLLSSGGFSNAGIAYLFDLTNGTLLDTFAPTSPGTNRRFGTKVQLTSQYAYIFEADGTYTMYRLSDNQIILNRTNPTGAGSPSIAAAGSHFIVGNPGFGQFNQGLARTTVWTK